MQFQIISDGSCDLTMELREKYNIQVVPFYVSFDGENYQKEIDEIGIRDVYERMVTEPDVYPKTSLPSVQSRYLHDDHQYLKRCLQCRSQCKGDRA